MPWTDKARGRLRAARSILLEALPFAAVATLAVVLGLAVVLFARPASEGAVGPGLASRVPAEGQQPLVVYYLVANADGERVADRAIGAVRAGAPPGTTVRPRVAVVSTPADDAALRTSVLHERLAERTVRIRIEDLRPRS